MSQNDKELFQEVRELQDSGKHRDAADRMRELLQVIPDSSALWMLYGDILSDLHSWEEAEAAFAKALNLNPEDVTAHLVRGAMLSDRGKGEEAEACFLKALELDPENELAKDSLSDMKKHGHLT